MRWTLLKNKFFFFELLSLLRISKVLLTYKDWKVEINESSLSIYIAYHVRCIYKEGSIRAPFQK